MKLINPQLNTPLPKNVCPVFDGPLPIPNMKIIDEVKIRTIVKAVKRKNKIVPGRMLVEVRFLDVCTDLYKHCGPETIELLIPQEVGRIPNKTGNDLIGRLARSHIE